MLWQYLLLTTAILSVESKFQQIFLRNNVNSKLVKPRGQSSRRHPINQLRIRNEYPLQLQGGEDNVQYRGGNVTNSPNFPYMAAVIINGRLWCAGAIVESNWVLTAAHCLNYVLRVSPSKSLSQYVKVRVGSSKAHEGGTLVDVIGAIRHPKYEQEPVPHADVALMKLADHLEFHKYVNLIHMYEGTTEPYAQSFVEVSGWGATKSTFYDIHEKRWSGSVFYSTGNHTAMVHVLHGSDSSFHEHSEDMLTARLKVRPQQYCVDSYQLVDAFQFTSDFFCASLRNGTRDACLFDAGAPAVQNSQLLGLMSFGPEKCGQSFQPAVFIKTFYFRDFVNSIISEYRSPKEMKKTIKEAELDEELPEAEPEYGPANIVLISAEESKDTARV